MRISNFEEAASSHQGITTTGKPGQLEGYFYSASVDELLCWKQSQGEATSSSMKYYDGDYSHRDAKLW